MKKEIYIALGYFDSVHLGHREVIKKCIEKAGKKYLPVVFTFKGNLKKAIGEINGKNIFSPKEREILYKDLGIKEVFFAPVSKSFLSKGKLAFLNYLNSKYVIKGYVCGIDFRFGKGGEGNVDFLTKYADMHNQEVVIVKTLKNSEKKVSTTTIKELLSIGEIDGANKLLGFDYFLTGKVFHDRKIGRTLGFPTLNINTDKDRFLIKEGVYAGYVIIDNVIHKAVINYGARPTFNLDGKLIETHILDYNGNLYNKVVKVYFKHFIREVRKFTTVEELKTQIEKDIMLVKNYD